MSGHDSVETTQSNSDTQKPTASGEGHRAGSSGIVRGGCCLLCRCLVATNSPTVPPHTHPTHPDPMDPEGTQIGSLCGQTFCSGGHFGISPRARACLGRYECCVPRSGPMPAESGSQLAPQPTNPPSTRFYHSAAKSPARTPNQESPIDTTDPSTTAISGVGVRGWAWDRILACCLCILLLAGCPCLYLALEPKTRDSALNFCMGNPLD